MTGVKSQATSTKYDGIIPTGWLTAYGRIFSDIPYSSEVFDQLETLLKSRGTTETLDIMKDANLAPQFEVRHKLLDKLIKMLDVRQIMEIAAGISTRGLTMTDNTLYRYVEVDLPHMIADKVAILKNLQNDQVIKPRPNLYLESGNAVEFEDLLNATKHFDQTEPIIVLNEGLLRYLNFDEKIKYTENIKKLLMKFGGFWITSDISLPKVIQKEDDIMIERRKKISEVTGVEVTNNLFKDEEDAKRFFNNLGFTVESHSFLEVIDELSSPSVLGMPRDYVEAINASPVCFVMKLKDQV